MIIINNKATLKINKTGNIIFHSLSYLAIGQYSLTSASYISAGIYKASDNEPKTLLRTLISEEYNSSGIHTLYWDGLDDNGNNIISTNDYEAHVLSHNITSSWHTVGNTSTLNHGGTNYHGYSRFSHLAIYGNNVYIGQNYDEAGARKGFYFNKSVDIQSSINILPQSSDPNAANVNDTNLNTPYNCTDGTNVYWGGIDPGGIGASWVYGTQVSNNLNLAWVSGSSIKCAFGATYPNATSIVVSSSANEITGMCTDGTNLFVARGTTNTIYTYNCLTGGLIATNGGWSNPRELVYDNSNGGRVFFLNTTSSIPTMATIGVSGSLTSSSLSISDFPSNILTLGLDNNSHELAAIVGGITQQVWFWNISASTPSGTNTGKLGQLGGYQSTALVSNDRFLFSDSSSVYSWGLTKPYIAYDSSSSLYVGDVGCERLQIFNSSKIYSNTIQIFPTLYATSVNLTEPTKIYAGALEFTINPVDASWTFTRNFRAQLTIDSLSGEGYNIFKYCSTLFNGRTYATLDNFSQLPTSIPIDIVELSNSGIIYTGVPVNSSGFYTGYLDKYFTSRKIASSNGFNSGSTPSLKTTALSSSFTSSSINPIYGTETTTVTFNPLNTGDALAWGEGYGIIAGVSDNNLVYVFNNSITPTCSFHLQAYDISTGQLKTSTARPTTNTSNPPFLGYLGWFPNAAYYDIGNGVRVTTAPPQVLGDYICLKYYGEFWKAAQTNYHNLYYKNSLMLTQFGTNRVQAQAIETSAPKSAGNGLGYRFAIIDNDTSILTHGDESVHSSLHLWLLKNMSSINIQIIPINPPTIAPIIGTNLLRDLTFNSVITTTGSITVSHAEGSGFTSQCGNKSPYYNIPDATVMLEAGSATNGDIKYVNFSITPSFNMSSSSYTVSGEIMLFGYGNDATLTPTSIFQLLDNTGKVISQIGQGNVIVTGNFEITANNTTLYSGNPNTQQDLIINTIQQWQPFSIKVNSNGCIMSYGTGSAFSASLMNPSASWSNIQDARIVVKRISNGDGIRGISIRNTTYVIN